MQFIHSCFFVILPVFKIPFAFRMFLWAWPCMAQAASTGVFCFTRSQTKTFCHSDCKNSEEKQETMSLHEEEDDGSQTDMAETIRKLENLFVCQNEFFEETLSTMQASIDKVAAPKLKPSAKLEPFSSYEKEDVNCFLEKYNNRLQAREVKLSSEAKVTNLASYLKGPAETWYFSLNRLTRSDYDSFVNALRQRFSSDDFKWRLSFS